MGKEAEDWLADSQKASEDAEAAAQRATKEGLEKRKEKEAAMDKSGKKVREMQEAADKELEGVKYSAHEKKMVKINAAKDKEAKIVKTAKAEKEAARKKVKEAQVKAQKAQHAFDLKIKESAGVTKEVQDFWDKEGARKTKQCGSAFADCHKNWCCALGCECVGKSKYYAECKGLGGKSYCDAGPFQAKHAANMKEYNRFKAEQTKLNQTRHGYWDHYGQLKEQAKQIEAAADKRVTLARKDVAETTLSASKEMEKAVSVVKEKWERKVAPALKEQHEKAAPEIMAAAKAGTAKVKAIKFAKEKKMAVESAEKSVLEKKRKAEDAKAAIALKREAQETWERMAKGETCDASSIVVIRKKK